MPRLELFPQDDDQFEPERERHPLAGFGKGRFADHRPVPTPRIVFASLAVRGRFAPLLRLEQIPSKLLLVFQELQRPAQDQCETLRAMNRRGKPQPYKIGQPQGALAQLHAGTESRLGKHRRRKLLGKRPNIPLTNLVPYIRPAFVREHLRVLLAKSLRHNVLCQ